MTAEPMPASGAAVQTKFCKFCGTKIPVDAVICTACGRQVEMLAAKEPQIVINNTNTNTNSNVNQNVNGAYALGRPKKQVGSAPFMHLHGVRAQVLRGQGGHGHPLPADVGDLRHRLDY